MRYLAIIIIIIGFLACNKSQNGFVGNYGKDSKGLDGGSYAGSTKRYILAANLNSAGKNVSVLSFKPFDATQDPYKNYYYQDPYYSGYGKAFEYDRQGYYNLPHKMATIKREQELDFQVGIDPVAVEVTPDNSLVLTANYSAGTVSVIDVSALHNKAGNSTEKSGELAAVPVGQGPTKIAIVRNIALVVNSESRDISVVEINGASSRLIKNVALEKEQKVRAKPHDIAISREGDFALITFANDWIIGRMNLKLDPQKYHIELYRNLYFEPRNILFTPYANTVIISSESRLIIHNLDLPDEFFLVPNYFDIDGKISDVAISRDGLYIVVVEETTYTATVIKSSRPLNEQLANPQKLIGYFKNIMSINQDKPPDDLDLTTNYQGNFWALDNTFFNVVAKFQLKEKPVKVAIDPRTNRFAVITTQNPGGVIAIYLNDNRSKLVGQIKTGNELSDITFL